MQKLCNKITSIALESSPRLLTWVKEAQQHPEVVLMISKFNAEVKISEESIKLFIGRHRFISNDLFFPKIW